MMANQEHLDKLKEGVEAWNQWRYKHDTIRPDLNDADLKGNKFYNGDLRGINLNSANLRSADLSGANLYCAALNGADLSNANLRGTELGGAYLSGANLSYTELSDANLGYIHISEDYGDNLGSTNLSNAKLIGANLNHTDLHGANLSGANLSDANLSGADLSGANFSNTRVLKTVFGNIDLSGAKGLETVIHDGPSTIGIDTIYRSHGNIPEIFLKGAGVDDTFITYIRSLAGSAIGYYSCFISYSSKDEAFAKRLYADLQSHNVRCWFAPEDLKWGEKIGSGIDEAIRLHDKLLLILSKSSVASGWVEHEVKAALAKERKEKRVTLFPVRVDKAVLDSPLSWATEIRHERNIGDFTRWKTHDEYEKAFARLLHDLKADAHQTEIKGE